MYSMTARSFVRGSEPSVRRAECGGVPDQVDSKEIAQGLRGEAVPAPSTAGSNSNASAAACSTTPGSTKMCNSSFRSLGRARIGLPAGTQMIDPAEGGICRVTPANRVSNCCGGWLKSERMWRGCPHR